MMPTWKLGVQIALVSGLCAVGCATTRQMSYRDDVQPVIADKCLGCHTPPYGEGYRRTGLDMTSYNKLMAGSIYGPVVIPGNSRASPLNMLVEGRAGRLARILENQHSPMTYDEIRVLHLWVEQGAIDN